MKRALVVGLMLSCMAPAPAIADVPMGETCSQTTINVTAGNWEQLYYESTVDRSALVTQNNHLQDEIDALTSVISNRDVTIMNQKSQIMRLKDKIKEMRR